MSKSSVNEEQVSEQELNEELENFNFEDENANFEDVSSTEDPESSMSAIVRWQTDMKSFTRELYEELTGERVIFTREGDKIVKKRIKLSEPVLPREAASEYVQHLKLVLKKRNIFTLYSDKQVGFLTFGLMLAATKKMDELQLNYGFSAGTRMFVVEATKTNLVGTLNSSLYGALLKLIKTNFNVQETLNRMPETSNRKEEEFWRSIDKKLGKNLKIYK